MYAGCTKLITCICVVVLCICSNFWVQLNIAVVVRDVRGEFKFTGDVVLAFYLLTLSSLSPSVGISTFHVYGQNIYQSECGADLPWLWSNSIKVFQLGKVLL